MTVNGRIIIICGPTAVGKSKIALKLAEKYGGEIVSADSQQVWRGLDIGTAKPTPDDLRRVPHHLIDVATPGEKFDVSRWVELADVAIVDIRARGSLPFVVGGAGMYIQTLLYGLCEAPPQDSEIRKRLFQEIETDGLASLYKRLVEMDPTIAGKMHPNDTTRIIRSLEVFELTGLPLSRFHEEHQQRPPRIDAIQIGIDCDRAELHDKIHRRVDWMMMNGWDEEVRELFRFYSADTQAFASIGYKQIIRYLRGEMSRESAVEEIKIVTRQYARRQLTWFRRDGNIRWFGLGEIEKIEAAFFPMNRER